jgi:uncharacterized protein
MAKILFLTIAAWLIITIIKRYQRSVSDTANPKPPDVEEMIRCVKCGIHLPKSDGIIVDQQYYCCEAHSKAPK